MNSKNNFDKKLLLQPENMIRLYAQGAFPMADENNNLDWYCPEIRTVILIEKFNLPRSLRKFMESCSFEYRYDFNTMEIVKRCADRESTWISAELIDAYDRLEKNRHLHSVSVYKKNKLVGGLYGVTYRGAFFGESMFSKVSQASKAALVMLWKRLKQKGFSIIDVQYQTDHLKMFGAEEIDFDIFVEYLREAYSQDVKF